jgi:hypothetical protein
MYLRPNNCFHKFFGIKNPSPEKCQFSSYLVVALTLTEQTLTSEKNSFSIRTAKYWNKLPENILNAPSINSFKNRLDKHWKDEELYYANYEGDIRLVNVTIWLLIEWFRSV